MEGESSDGRVVRPREDEELAVFAARPGGGAGHSRAGGAVQHPVLVGTARGAVYPFPSPNIVSRQGGKDVVVGEGVVRIGVLVSCRRAGQKPSHPPGEEEASSAGVAGGKTKGGGVEVGGLMHEGAQCPPRALP